MWYDKANRLKAILNKRGLLFLLADLIKRTLGIKKLDDIDLDLINLEEHKTILPKGIELYRYVFKGSDPLQPSGKAGRFVSEPPDFSLEKFAKSPNSVVSSNICNAP